MSNNDESKEGTIQLNYFDEYMFWQNFANLTEEEKINELSNKIITNPLYRHLTESKKNPENRKRIASKILEMINSPEEYSGGGKGRLKKTVTRGYRKYGRGLTKRRRRINKLLSK